MTRQEFNQSRFENRKQAFQVYASLALVFALYCLVGTLETMP